MRVLAVQPGPAFSVHDLYVGWCEGLRSHGVEVTQFNLDDRLAFYDSALMPTSEKNVFRKAVPTDDVIELALNGIYASLYKVRPDILLAVSGFFLPTDLYARARSYGTKVVLVHTEEPYEHDREIGLAPHVDLNVLNDPTNLDAFTALAPSVYLPHAYRSVLHYPGTPKERLVCDLAFVGTGYPSRAEFFEQMDLDGLDVLLAGNWQHIDPDSPLRGYVAHEIDECLDNSQTADVYRSARVGMNLYRREATAGGSALGWAMGPREVEMAACGLFYLREPRAEGDDVLHMLPTFTDAADASEKVRWWLAHPEERAETALKARAAIADRTFANNAAALLRLLDQ